MKKTILIILITIVLTNCDTRPINQSIDGAKESKDSVIINVDRFFNNPIRDINNFDFKTGNDYIDSLHKSYSDLVMPKVEKNICIGDNCESYQTFISNKDNSTFYFFKGDGGEYGFSNAQYLLHNDSLIFVREFIIGIEKWSTDSTNTLWIAEETTYHFVDANVTYTRKYTFPKTFDSFDFSLKTIKKAEMKLGTDSIYKVKAEELKELLQQKDSEYRDN